MKINLLYFIQISDLIFYFIFNKNNKYSRRKITFLKIYTVFDFLHLFHVQIVSTLNTFLFYTLI